MQTEIYIFSISPAPLKVKNNRAFYGKYYLKRRHFMTDKRTSKIFTSNIRISETCCFGGTLESEGPLGKFFDGFTEPEPQEGQSWEKHESDMIQNTVKTLLEKAEIPEKEIGLLLGGDLMNQCTSSAYGLEEFDIPYIGLYGACSTFAEGIMTGSMYLEADACRSAIATASSHFCSAERQYRFPLSYGAFPQGTSQHTVTGCGAALLEKTEGGNAGIYVKSALPGIVINSGITNASNMGAAMATAAADTILRHLNCTGTTLTDYDMIATGDLGKIGLEMLKDMLKSHGHHDKDNIVTDCGVLVYDTENQDVSCGGSGCGCSAVTFCGYIFDRMKKKELQKVLLVGTGAMMSPQSLLQGLSIPAVAHLVEFEVRL